MSPLLLLRMKFYIHVITIDINNTLACFEIYIHVITIDINNTPACFETVLTRLVVI